MFDLFWFSDAQMARLAPCFLQSHGRPRVDDRRVSSGIIFISRTGLRCRDAPAEYGPHKTLYNRWKRWSAKGIFARMLASLEAGHVEKKTVMIDATDLKAHRTATSVGVEKRERRRLISRKKRFEGRETVQWTVPPENGIQSCTPSVTAKGARSTCLSPPVRSATTSARTRC